MVHAVAVVGCGLSGLSCGVKLLELADAHGLEINVTFYDARDRLGGRIFTTEEGHDLGASWHWKQNDTALLRLAKDLGVETERQLVEGRALSQARALFSSPGLGATKATSIGMNLSPCGEDGAKFRGGAISLINKSSVLLQSKGAQIKLSTSVKAVTCTEKQKGGEGQSEDIKTKTKRKIALQTEPQGSSQEEGEGGTALFDVVVLALPPQVICKSIEINPPLSSDKVKAMMGCDAWMGESGKVCFVYSKRFWLEKQLSGCVFSQTGPLSQIWDSSTYTAAATTPIAGSFALCGFVSEEVMETTDCLASEQIVREMLLPQLVLLFGEEAANPVAIYFKSWKDDPCTNGKGSEETGRSHSTVGFGHPLLHQQAGGGCLIFAGTETTPGENGHMNGAVLSGERAAREVLSFVLEDNR